mgnify:CR=1 FL=1
MHRALVDENGLLGRLDADVAIHRLICELRLVTRHHDLYAPKTQTGRWAKAHLHAAIKRPGRSEIAVVQPQRNGAFRIVARVVKTGWTELATAR